MEIDNHPIPDTIVDAFCRLVDKLDSGLVVAMSAENQKLFQGHRIILKNVPVARQRIKLLLKNERQLDSAAAILLRSVGLFRAVVTVLSESALEAGFSSLATYFGEADFLAAALLDERESTRKLAHEFISGWDGQLSDEARRKLAAEDLRTEFTVFLSSMKELLGDVLPAVVPTVQREGRDEKGKFDAALEAAKADLARQSQRHARDQKDLQNKIELEQQEIKRLRTQLADAGAETKVLKAGLSEVQQQFGNLQTSVQQRIDDGVSTALSGRLRQWLMPVVKVEDALAQSRQSDLLARAVEALTKQRVVDRHSGNLAELTRAIEERRQMLAEIERARIEALKPIPELASIAAALEREIGHLGRQLGLPGDQASTTGSALLARINAAVSLDELSTVRQFIQQAATYALLRRDELHRLYRATNDKAGLLYDTIQLPGEDRSGLPATKYFHPLHAAAQGQPFTLFIDGHNVLFLLEGRFGHWFEKGIPGRKARVEFANSLLPIFDKPGADVMLFFDGNDATEQSLSDYVRVFYSGGTGDHRADNAILEHISFCLQAAVSTPICLVTKDGDFARQAGAMGVTIMDPEEFATLLEIAADGPSVMATPPTSATGKGLMRD